MSPTPTCTASRPRFAPASRIMACGSIRRVNASFARYLAAVQSKRRVNRRLSDGLARFRRAIGLCLAGRDDRAARQPSAHPRRGGARGLTRRAGRSTNGATASATLASGHVLLTLAISAALAGPLLHLAGYEGGGVHSLGQSSTGKTTVLRLAASVWGRGAHARFCPSLARDG